MQDPTTSDDETNGESLQDTPSSGPELTPMEIENLPEFITHALSNAGWTSLTPVQASTLPYALEMHDLMVQAKTGSGKTGAFLLPLIERIDPIEIGCQALILVPTRELAVQVVKEAEVLLDGLDIPVIPVYGGVSYDKQIRAFKNGAQIIVGTPGRILDHLDNGALRLDSLTTLVFDEADRMLSMGFYQDMVALKSFLPEHKIHTNMFSATFPPMVRSLAIQFVNDPVFVDLSTDAIAADAVEHVAFLVEGTEKDDALVNLLQIENPDGAIIFCNTRTRVNYVNTVLQRKGFNADLLTSDLPQHAREKVLDRIKTQKLNILVATDVAARGIDIPHLSHSIQYELPEDLEVYIHRAGRTGRAGASGTAYSIVAGVDELLMHKLIRKYNIEFVEKPVPTKSEMLDALYERAKEKISGSIGTRDQFQIEMARQLMPLIQRAQEDEEVAAVMSWVFYDFLFDKRPEKLTEVSSGNGKSRSSSSWDNKQDKKSKKDKGRSRGGRNKGKKSGRSSKNKR
ncbi:MAG: DEAD/DEAH box helicase [Chloroflexota bacterium]